MNRSMAITGDRQAGLLAAMAVAIALTVPSLPVFAATETWAPVASEKLMQLPGDSLLSMLRQ